MGMHIERKTVSPRTAKAWLKKNAENNRNPRTKSRIPMMVRDMLAGDWQEDTGETIKFDETGRLIDGQHRLMAVVESEVTITFDVAYDVPVRAMPVLDTGVSRTGNDVLKMAGAQPGSGALLSSIVRWVIMYEAGNPAGGGGSTNPTHSQILHRFRAETGAFESAAQRGADCSKAGVGNGSVVGVSHYLFSKIDAEQARTFFDMYVSGVVGVTDHPVLTLRNRIISSRSKRLTRGEGLYLFVKAWNAYRHDRPLPSLALPSTTVNSKFPIPE